MIDFYTDSVSLLTIENGIFHRVAYANSTSGREALQAEQPPEIVVEVMAVWGETPTVPGPSPPPAPEQAPPTPQEDADALLVDHEYRLTLLELGVN